MSGITRFLNASLLLAVGACSGASGLYGGGGGGGNQNPPPPNTVNATPSLAFTPSTLTINTGEAATFAFGTVEHNVVFDGRIAATPVDILGNNANVSVQRTFNTAGTYNYHCNIHPSMTGTVIVR